MTDKSFAGVIKAAILLLFLCLVFVLFRHPSLRNFLHPQALQEIAFTSGPFAPAFFVLLYAIGISLFLPASLFTAAGAIIFGLGWGLCLNFAGAMLGASISFLIGRYLAQDFTASLIGDRLRGYDKYLAGRGFETTLYLRLVFFPFTPLNFGLGLTSINFRQFFWGTFFGKVASGVILTFFFSTMAEVWNSGHWQGLWGWKSSMALLFFLASFLVPIAARRLFPNMAAEKA